MSAHGRALSALVTLSVMATAPPVRAGSKCGAETCAAEALQRQPPHYALLQIRGKLSSSSVSKELDEDKPLQGLPAAGLADISVFRDGSKNLTAFEEDYLLDDNNPLDGISAAEGTSAALSNSGSSSGDASADSSSSSSSSSEADSSSSSSEADSSSSEADSSGSKADSSSSSSEADGSQPAAHSSADDSSVTSGSGCCKEDKAECLACKEGSSVEVYCALHAKVQGCELIFDCDAGVEHWQAGWSDLKKIWCCQNKKVGCSSSDSTPAPASSDDFDEDLIHDGIVSNASAPTSNVSALNATRRRCVTRLDPRASAMGYTTSLPGTPCVFGTDDRDEGFHCIMDDGSYGSFGWCWTSSKQDSWGSCSESCPLFGQAKVLGDYIQSLEKKLADAMTTTTTTTTATNTTTTETTTTTTTTANATNTTGKASKGTNSSSGKNASKSGKGPGGDQASAGKGPGKDKGKDTNSGPSKKGGLDLSTGKHGN